MELSDIKENIFSIFNITKIDDIGEKLMSCVKNADEKIYSNFAEMLNEDLSVDYLQPVYQYYLADRKEKKQDYTPKCLSNLVGRLIGEADTITDMCAGSGSLTIQKWNQDHEQKFILYEIDENVLPFLLFNMALRNIECTVYHADVLQQQVFRTYKICKGENYGIIENEEGI